MDNFKKTIYDSYISNHNKNLYGENSLSNIAAHFPAWKHYYGRHLPPDKNVSILDIGCGDGTFVHCLHTFGYKNTYGIDLSAEQINKGKSMGIPNLECADLKEYLGSNPMQYDVIIAKDVIEHFTRNEVFEILPMISKGLKHGGRFIMQVPNGQGIFYTSVFYGDYTHEMAYTASSVNQVILNTGFRSSKCYPTGPVPTGIKATIRLLFWRLKVMQLKFWKMVETGSPHGIFTQNIIAVIEK
jgi:2-polyprenyl-3-methyl-5-hydroxy-6-metoxy-1,4-benzoquinol methylase